MYLSWNKKTISDFSDENINSLYENGFLFTRTGKGEMYQTRSLRIDLSKFELNSENRRVLRHVEDIKLETHPIPYADYHWGIHKLGKDFYETKFGEKTFSAQKIKELITDPEKSNFDKLLTYTVIPQQTSVISNEREKSFTVILSETKNPLNTNLKGSFTNVQDDKQKIGFVVCKETNELLHYCYPFYDLNSEIKNLGLGMMTKAVIWAKEQNKKYVYLGSFSRPTDTYKLQFDGIEWFDGKNWSIDLEKLKEEIK